MRLAKLLVGEDTAEAALAMGGEEHRVDLDTPIPVYITYFTVMPTDEGLVFRPDVYGRDAEWATQHAHGGATSAPGGR